ncbi:MAG TPA: DUF4832 domain-containing protein [Candidatus Tectomicrobia bacterium]
MARLLAQPLIRRLFLVFIAGFLLHQSAIPAHPSVSAQSASEERIYLLLPMLQGGEQPSAAAFAEDDEPVELPSDERAPSGGSAMRAFLPLVQGSRPVAAVASPAPDAIFADGFESGHLSAWTSSATGGGDLSVGTAAALVGTYGLQAAINDNTSLYVTDDQPNAEPRYRARFYFDPNSISMVSGDTHFLFYGYSGATTVVLRVQFRFYNGNYQLRAALRNDSTTWKNSSWFTLSDAAHFVELDWQAATAAGANDGYLTLWIDGVQKANLTAVDNDTRRIDRVRLGAVAGIDTGTRGTYFFDAFESRRQTSIGPATATPTATPTPTPTPTATPTSVPTASPVPTSASGDLREVTYAPSNEDFANPERGFMYQKSIWPDQGTDQFVGIKRKNPADSLVWVYFRLDNYRNGEIDPNGLAIIRGAFQDARQKGLKLVIRFVYNDGPGYTSDPNSANPDAPIDLVLQHINQLKPILVENADVIAAMQAGFVGHWGEWHSSKYLNSLEDRKTILDTLLSALPKERMLQVRYPRDKQVFYGGPLAESAAFSEQAASRIGHHNDCFLRDDDDAATYRSKTVTQYCKNPVDAEEIACWKDFVAQEGRFTPVGGESCQANPPRTDCSNALQELETLHWSFINNGYSKAVLDSWTAGGCMDTIRRRLGYRLVLKKARFSSSVQPGGLLNLEIQLSNTGYAALYNPRPVFVVLTGGGRRYELPLPTVDPRRWEAGQEYTIAVSVPVPTNVVAGTYQLSLWLPDQANPLRNIPAYAVRFANLNVWDATTGLNILTADFPIILSGP